MSMLPSWASSDADSMRLTEKQYDALPDEVRKRIEVIGGNVVFLHSGTREHNRVARRLAHALEAARPDSPCVEVNTDVDVQFVKWNREDRGFSFRRPDVSVNRCLDRGAKLMSSDVLLAAEVVSPGSAYIDTVDKVAEYAYEGIPVYLVVHLDGDLYVKLIQEYRLDWVSRTYRLVETHQGQLVLDDPFPAKVPFSELDD
ncbi:Uma2 family endonuclease [Actinomadura adrarensis]|uniref:Uma2 family endonuclease n=1 Tax=Actinomadura adrarensis TaxID=1819600 RepID=A0ABW3CRJ6_9ACTN